MLFKLLYSSDPRVVFAFWVGVSTSLASLVLFVGVLVLRKLAQWRERRHLQAATVWRQVLEHSMREGVPAQLPALTRHDMTGFMEAWNDLHEQALLAHDNPRIGELAQKIALAPRLEKLAVRGSFHERIMSIIALGYLRCAATFDRVEPLLNDASPIISICAAHALMRIDSERAAQRVVSQILSRQDWVDGGVAQILQEARPEVVQDHLADATLRANDETSARMVRFLADISPKAAAPVIRQILAEPHDEHLISVCLQVISDPQDLDKVRLLLKHPRWHVRMHAASAIGRLGGCDDVESLLPLLSDAQWWVRYRTAQAIAHLLQDPDALVCLRDRQQDRFARDILTQVLAEQTLAVGTV
jgi:hypothetical protein